MDDRNRESYTVMILPNPTSKTYRFSVSRKSVKIVFSAACVAVIFLLVFVVQYFYMVGNIWELTSLRQETAAQKSKIEFFAQSVDGLKRQMERLKEFDVKLRMITDLNVPANASKYLGVGGETDAEAPLPGPGAGPEGGEGGTEVPIEAPDFMGSSPGPCKGGIRSSGVALCTLQVTVVRQEQS